MLFKEFNILGFPLTATVLTSREPVVHPRLFDLERSMHIHLSHQVSLAAANNSFSNEVLQNLKNLHFIVIES